MQTGLCACSLWTRGGGRGLSWKDTIFHCSQELFNHITVRSGQITMFSKFPTFQHVTVTGAPNDAEHSWWALTRAMFLWCSWWGWISLLLSDFIYQLITWSYSIWRMFFYYFFPFFLCLFSSFYISPETQKPWAETSLCDVWCFGVFLIVCFNQVWRWLNKLNKVI